MHKRYQSLNNSLQLPCIADCILNNLATSYQDILFRPHLDSLLQREIDSPVINHPTPLFGVIENGAFTVEKEKVFRIGDGQEGVGFF